MRSRARSTVIFAAITAAGIASLSSVRAYAFPPGQAGDTTADRVLGQPDFTHNSPNTIDASSLATQSNVARVAIDRSVSPNRVYVVDEANSRVLGFHSVSALVNGAPADLVIGQPDFFSGACNLGGVSPKTLCIPKGAAVDSVGNLWVADSGSNRVLEYTDPFTAFNSTGKNANFAASKVFGQGGSFYSAGCDTNGGTGAPTAKNLCNPHGIAIDGSGNLWVADHDNNRVLEFNSALSSDTTADFVLGQGGSFITATCNKGGITATSLCAPVAIAVDGNNNVYVADFSNSRVLEFNTPLTTDATADHVFGQAGSFSSANCDSGGVASGTLCFPTGVGVDASKNLYIADTSNNRVLEYNETTNPPTNVSPNHVYGQAGLTTNPCGNNPPSATNLCTPTDAQVDAGGELFVLDSANNRALRYNTPLTSATANVVIGQPDFAHNSSNSVDKEGMNNPGAIVIDTSVNPNRLYVVDTSNNRVLGFSSVSALVNGAAATIVIGQPDLFSGLCNNGGLTGAGLCTPAAAAVDGSGNLFVSDFGNNRVLEYNAPFSQAKVSGFVANHVYGQPNLTSNACATAAAGTLCGPDGLAIDSGNLFVADRNNDRVLEYNSALSNATANHEFGQGAGSGTDFTDTSCNGAGITSTSLCHPYGVAVDASHNVYIADHDNHRVLEFNQSATPPTNFTANSVFGQAGSLTSNTCNNGGVSANSLCNPHKVAVDAAKNLYVSDSSNNRVLLYKTPLTTNTTADMVFGQVNNLTSNGCNLGGSRPSANTLCTPVGVAIDSGSNVYIGDQPNHRVLEYFNPLATPGAVAVPASLGFGNIAKSNTSVVRSVSAKNNGSVPVNFTGLSITGTNAGDFTSTSNTCLGYLLAGATCTVSLDFHPAAVVGTVETATLTLVDNASNTPQTVALSGTSSNQTTVNPTSLTFSVPHGTTSAAKSVTFTNNQSSAISVSVSALSSPYATTANTCGSSLAAFSSCTVSVDCTPGTATTFPGTLTITDSPDSLSPHNVTLSCTGT